MAVPALLLAPCLGAVLLIPEPRPADGQTPRPIAEVLHDADGDRIPDAVGTTVTVTGWASTAGGQLGEAGPAFYVQDATGGIAAVGLVAPSVRAGDPLVLRGTLRFETGTPYLDRPRVERGVTRHRLPPPLRVTRSDLEAIEGRLVQAEGVVVGRSRVEAGEALLLSLPDHSIVVAFAFRDRPSPLSFVDHKPGDRVRVTGVAGQFDRVAPFDEGYQIYPRTAADVRPAGLPRAFYRRGALAALALCLAALGWAAALRRQVRLRVDALRESEGLYRQLVDRASDAVFLHDLVGRSFEANRSAREALGIGEHDPVPRPIEAVAAEHHARLKGHATSLRRSGKARTDFLIRRADGSTRLFEFESQTLRLNGLPIVLSLARDVEARRRYEQGLIEAREQAEETARAKSAFLANMSHEIRTPLTAVIGFAEILRDEVGPEQQDLVDTIEAGGRRLLSTLNSVLNLARLDAGREALRPETLDLVDHVGRGLDLFRPLAEQRGLTLTFEPAVPRLSAVLDGGALDRVLTNLLGNAVKFTDRGGVSVQLAEVDGEAVLTVADTGIGMSEAFLPDLFSEFRQESEGPARQHEGTGLGMSITKRLVELMGGRITVESRQGQGTTFTVRLPLGVPDPLAPPLRQRLAETAA